MEELQRMGFSGEESAQALAATGGNSVQTAIDWILTRNSSSCVNNNNNTNPNPNPNPCSSPLQLKLDRFFKFPSKQSSIEEEPITPISKRPKLLQSSSDNSVHQQQQSQSQSQSQSNNVSINVPLPERMRPLTVFEVVGQDHLLHHYSLLRSAIDRGSLHSLIFWGPPGTGKTTLAKSIVNSSQFISKAYKFVSLSAVTCGVKDVRDAVENAKKSINKKTVLFVDEVHRFNKSQQDSFLPYIEDGSIVFMGATTENPSFHLTMPLLSRCRVLTLNPLKPNHIDVLLRRAVHDTKKGLSMSVGKTVGVSDDAIHFLSSNCDGDARVALNALEISATTAAARDSSVKEEKLDTLTETEQNHGSSCEITITLADVKEALQCKTVAYDRDGEEHYNQISALHKSMRGSDPNASIYWLARMLEGGEQPLYIARRLVRFASEDVGLADPTALNQAVACYQACHFIGMPECNVILAQCVVYLAIAPKSIAVYQAIKAAQKVVRESVGQNEGVPLHLRNAPTKLMKELGYSEGYIYTPDNPSAVQTFLPPSLKGYKFLDWPNSKESK
ncbi:hypothetical protein ACFE04_021156 [Oxalis oulophora]